MKTIVLISLIATIFTSHPVAVFHGIGDLCWNPGMSNIVNEIGRMVNNKAFCIESGAAFASFYKSFPSQVESACQQMQENPAFEEDFSMVGISQGNLVALAIISQCRLKGKPVNWLSFGGPLMGTGIIPQLTQSAFRPLNYLVSQVVLFKSVFNHVGPAGYFRNPQNNANYLAYNDFLPNLLNEKHEKSSDIKERFTKLKKLILVKFSEDTMINPPETAWFQFWDENYNVEPFEKSKFYQNDYIGLRELNESGKVDFEKLPGNHLDFDYEDLERFVARFDKN